MASFAISWLKVQGATEDSYGTNAGRKSLGKLCRKLDIPYEESVPMHGDLPDVWQASYGEGMTTSGSKNREQPRDPGAACKGLRKIAQFFGGGRKSKRKLSRKERFDYNILKALGHRKKANQILRGESSSDDDSSSSDSDQESDESMASGTRLESSDGGREFDDDDDEES